MNFPNFRKITLPEFVQALRDYAHRQYKGRLKGKKNLKEKTCYCFHGLILHLAAERENSPIVEQEIGFLDKLHGYRIGDSGPGHITQQLTDFDCRKIPIKLLDKSWQSRFYARGGTSGILVSTMELNDLGMPFPEIANLLEKAQLERDLAAQQGTAA